MLMKIRIIDKECIDKDTLTSLLYSAVVLIYCNVFCSQVVYIYITYHYKASHGRRRSDNNPLFVLLENLQFYCS